MTTVPLDYTIDLVYDSSRLIDWEPVYGKKKHWNDKMKEIKWQWENERAFAFLHGKCFLYS